MILNHLVFVDLSVFVEEQSVSGESRVAYIYLSRPMGCLCNVALITSINISTKKGTVSLKMHWMIFFTSRLDTHLFCTPYQFYFMWSNFTNFCKAARRRENLKPLPSLSLGLMCMCAPLCLFGTLFWWHYRFKGSVLRKLRWVKSSDNRYWPRTVALGIISCFQFAAILYLPFFHFWSTLPK